jgi:hypothetical protein
VWSLRGVLVWFGGDGCVAWAVNLTWSSCAGSGGSFGVLARCEARVLYCMGFGGCVV